MRGIGLAHNGGGMIGTDAAATVVSILRRSIDHGRGNPRSSPTWCATGATRRPTWQILTFVDVDEDGALREQTRTYRQLWDNGQRLAAWLRDQGMQAGDRFGLVMQNHPEFVDFMVASSILGTVFVPIDSRTRGAKLQYMLDFAGAGAPGRRQCAA